MFTSICRKLIKCKKIVQWALKKNLDTLLAVLFTRKETICDQLIKLIKCVQSASEMPFECAWKVEEQQSGCYNLVARKINKHEDTEVDSQLSWLAWRYKRLIKEDCYLPTSPPKMQPFVWPKWAMPTPFPSRRSMWKKNWWKWRRLPLTFLIAYFRSSASWYLLHPISILVWTDCMQVYQK